MSRFPFSPLRLLRAFRHAAAGVAHAVATEPNAQVHAAASVVVVLLSVWLRPTPVELAILALAVGMVWLAELLNTAVERVVDLVTEEPHDLARQAKDTAAGATLLASLAAVAVAACVFGPRLWGLVAGP